MTVTINGSSGVNLDYSTGGRITGDFSNATVANRVMFQTSTVNGATNVSALPNGTGTQGQFLAFNNQDPTAANGVAQLLANAVEVSVRSYSNTGSYLPLLFYTGGSERMRIDTSGNLLFNSGYGSVATAYGCRAWVNFNGTGTVAIRASGNVSSITDNGVGDYTVNFTTAMPDANYGMTLVGQRSDGSGVYNGTNGIYAGASYTPTASAIRVTTSGTTGTNGIDYIAASVNIFR